MCVLCHLDQNQSKCLLIMQISRQASGLTVKMSACQIRVLQYLTHLPALGDSTDGSSSLIPATYIRDQDWIPRSWLQPDLASAIVDI